MNAGSGPSAKSTGRPHMPGYGVLPASEGAGLLPWSYVVQRMKSAHNYWIVTASSDGDPHAAPVWGLWHESTFYFATGEASKKGRNLSENPRLIVHLESGDEVVILKGAIRRVRDTGLLRELDPLYYDKYSVHLGDGPTFVMVVETAFAWNERDFPGSATRWQFEAADGHGS